MNKQDKKIVVISGKQFSGKDTVANILKKYLSTFKFAPLADAIKIEFSKEKNLTFNEIERNKPIYRAELIVLGNKRRTEDPNYWIKKVLSIDSNIIVTDIRLKYEIKTFEKLNAIKIRVESDRIERAKRGKLVKENDPTEIDLDDYKDWDYLIENNGTVEELKEKSEELGKKIVESLSLQKV